MCQIKKGDIVGRKSYGKDIIFVVSNIINIQKKKIAILKGLVERIEADSDINDLELIEKKQLKKLQKNSNIKFETRLERSLEQIENKIGNRRIKSKIITGRILHLDGDRKYSEKSYKYYKKLGIDAIVKNIPEYRQPKVVYQLLKIYNPDILVITRT